MEIGKRLGIGERARSCRDSEGLCRGDWGDPGGDGGGEVFGQEGAEGLVLPGLDVTSRPVVEEADAEEVIGGAGDGYGDTLSAGFSDVKCELKFVV